jgi:hypothetical protein
MRSSTAEQSIRFAFVFGFIFLVAALWASEPRASLIMWFGRRSTDGVITHEPDPKNHNYLSFDYVVDGRHYEGTGYGANHAEMRAGEKVVTYYSRLFPSQAVLLTPTEQQGAALFGLISGLLMGTLFGFGDRWNRARALRSNAPPEIYK